MKFVLLQYKFAIIVNNRVSKYLDKDNVVNLNELSHTHITGFFNLNYFLFEQRNYFSDRCSI